MKNSWPELLLLGCALVVGALAAPGVLAAHQLAVTPPQPTTADSITVRVTGEWPGAEFLSTPLASRNASLIRLDAAGVLPGIPTDLESYERLVDLGRLPAGQYRVEYFIATSSAPVTTPVPTPVVTLEFLVAGAAVPTLQDGALAFLAAVLAAGALWVLHRRRSNPAPSRAR